MLKYVPVDKFNEQHIDILYELLGERLPEESISHKVMPSKLEHIYFVQNHPYVSWWIVYEPKTIIPIGAIYITKKGETGLAVLKAQRNKGYGKDILKTWVYNYKDTKPLYANINPANEKSIKLFEKAGFKHIQNTYKLD